MELRKSARSLAFKLRRCCAELCLAAVYLSLCRVKLCLTLSRLLVELRLSVVELLLHLLEQRFGIAVFLIQTREHFVRLLKYRLNLIGQRLCAVDNFLRLVESVAQLLRFFWCELFLFCKIVDYGFCAVDNPGKFFVKSQFLQSAYRLVYRFNCLLCLLQKREQLRLALKLCLSCLELCSAAVYLSLSGSNFLLRLCKRGFILILRVTELCAFFVQLLIRGADFGVISVFSRGKLIFAVRDFFLSVLKLPLCVGYLFVVLRFTFTNLLFSVAELFVGVALL